MSLVFAVPGFRARYYQEKREGLYGGATFITTYTMLSLPLSFISTLMSVGILMPVLDFNVTSWVYASGILWASYIVTEQITIATLMLIKRPITAAITVLYFTVMALTIASGTLRSLHKLPDWLTTVTIGLPIRYASLALNQLALDMSTFSNLPYNETIACPAASEVCRYPEGRAYLVERFTIEGDNKSQVLNVDLNLLISLAFSVGLILFNSVLYLLPLPSSVKAKFRE